MSDIQDDIALAKYIDEAKNDAIHSYKFLEETGTLTATRTFGVAHKIPGRDLLLHIQFPAPWQKDKTVTTRLSKFSENKDHLLNETRLDADTYVHAHTPYLASWSVAQIEFPILYVAAQRHLLARTIPNHLERQRSVLEVISERLDQHPEWAPPPAILESNGGANFWGKGILKTAQLILLIEEAAKLQSIAGQLGGAKEYTPGALEVQWSRTGLWEKSKAFAG